MKFVLSQKETMLLEDAKTQEDLCIKKYQSFAQQAKDPELKNLLNQLANEEQQHLDTINTLLMGQIPKMNSGSQKSQKSQQAQQANASTEKITFSSPQDALLCTDLLSTEKYVSSFYNTSIFEAANKPVREALQHIQKEEQEHGEKIFNYMNTHGMYNVK